MSNLGASVKYRLVYTKSGDLRVLVLRYGDLVGSYGVGVRPDGSVSLNVPGLPTTFRSEASLKGVLDATNKEGT